MLISLAPTSLCCYTPTPQELSLSRCSITDQGGAALMQALAAGYLACLDVSWNSLRGDTARALHETLALNGSLQQLVLSYNGFGDMDSGMGAR